LGSVLSAVCLTILAFDQITIAFFKIRSIKGEHFIRSIGCLEASDMNVEIMVD
jgi:hypothetical protein